VARPGWRANFGRAPILAPIRCQIFCPQLETFRGPWVVESGGGMHQSVPNLPRRTKLGHAPDTIRTSQERPRTLRTLRTARTGRTRLPCDLIQDQSADAVSPVRRTRHGQNPDTSRTRFGQARSGYGHYGHYGQPGHRHLKALLAAVSPHAPRTLCHISRVQSACLAALAGSALIRTCRS
jgi:hypothetical protein